MLFAFHLNAQERVAPKDTLWLVPHTHWEGAVFKTREEYLEIGLPNIVRALTLLKAHPEYRFVLDQACYVKPFLERYPEEEAAFRKFVSEGRLLSLRLCASAVALTRGLRIEDRGRHLIWF